MSGSYTRWYREGTISATEGSVNIVGKNTYWNTAGLKPGDILGTTNSTQFEIDAIIDDTHLTLKEPFPSSSFTNHKYYIIRNFNASFGAQAAAQATALCADVKRYIDGKQETLTGKSAYEVAVDEGFVGTQAEWLASLKGEPGVNGTNGTNGTNGQDGQSAYALAVSKGYSGTEDEWLESLKAANEWTTLNARTAHIDIAPPYSGYKVIQRSQLFCPSSNAYIEHGSVLSEADRESIINMTYENLFVGSRWLVPTGREFSFTCTNDNDEEVTYAATTTYHILIYVVDFNYFGSNEMVVSDCNYYNIYGHTSITPTPSYTFNAETGYATSSFRRFYQALGRAFFATIFGDELLYDVDQAIPSTFSVQNGTASYVRVQSAVECMTIEKMCGHMLYRPGPDFQGQFSYFKQLHYHQPNNNRTVSVDGLPGGTPGWLGPYGGLKIETGGANNYLYATIRKPS